MRKSRRHAQKSQPLLHGPAERTSHIAPFHVMDVLARARAMEAQGRRVIHMEVGEPDFATPDPIIAAGKEALEHGLTHYTPALGTPQIRTAIAEFYRTRYGVEVSPDRVIMAPGSSGALQLAMGAIINPGENVVLADPGYPCNRHFVRLFEGQPKSVPVGPDTAYQLTPELVEANATATTAAVMLATPSNPTGTVVAPEVLGEILDCTHAQGARLIVDEIYHGLVYEGEATTVLSLSDDVFVVNSFSKYFGMTGWRLGWLIAPTNFVRQLETLAQNVFLAPPTIAQHAALAAFAPQTIKILESRRREFEARRDFLIPALRDMGFDIPVWPEGAFYIYAGCSRFTDDSQSFALDLLERAGVAITPGIDFGNHAPERHVRFAYTTGLDELREGVERLSDYLRTL